MIEANNAEMGSPTIIQSNKDCQVFNGPLSGCTFSMPGGKGSKSSANKEVIDETEDIFKFIYPSITDEEEWIIHNQIKRLVTNFGIQEICGYLKELAEAKNILLPQSAEAAYNELCRMGMPDGDGFSVKTFMKYYRK